LAASLTLLVVSRALPYDDVDQLLEPGTDVRPHLRERSDPFQTEVRRPRFGRPLPDPRAEPAPAPIRDILGVSYYTDADHSIPDPARKRENQTALRPLHAYVTRAVALADGWAGSQPAKPRYAQDLVGLLASWADGGALLGEVNQEGRYERVWTLSSLAIAYLRIQDAPGLEAARRRTVEKWLAEVGNAVVAAFRGYGPDSRLNNHACWAALAVLAAGLAAHDQRLIDWAADTGRDAIGQIRSDGLMPLELRRKSLALHYHLFALAPLVMLSELATANHVPLAAGSDTEVALLAGRVIDGLRDPKIFAGAAGAKQTIRLPPRGADLAWAEIFYVHNRDPRLRAWIAAARPLRDDRLGGNMTLAFGVPDLK
jgi:poly(beta-D-mannuronate) lyase